MNMMNNAQIEYKGYKALIEYSAEDECLIGRVIGIKDIVGFHGESVREIRTEFASAIDGYLEANQKIGRKPNPPTDRVPVDVDAALLQAVKGRLQGTGTTPDEFVNLAVEKALYPQHP